MGGLGYMGLEFLWRRRTHWSMGLAGGLCTALLFWLYTHVAMPAWAAYLCGMGIISAVELAFGLLFNIKLKQNVWDYSAVRWNLWGQICLGFSLIWGVLGLLIWGVARLVA